MRDREIPRQNTEPQTKRMVWFRGQYVPVLYNSDRANIFAAERWVARGPIQRIGAIIFATIFFCGSMALFVASIFVRPQIAQTTGGILGQVFGITFAVLAFLGGCVALLLSYRIARSVIRAFQK